MITLPLVQMTSCSISDRIGGSDSDDQGCIYQVRQSAAIRYPQTKNLMSKLISAHMSSLKCIVIKFLFWALIQQNIVCLMLKGASTFGAISVRPY